MDIGDKRKITYKFGFTKKLVSGTREGVFFCSKLKGDAPDDA